MRPPPSAHPKPNEVHFQHVLKQYYMHGHIRPTMVRDMPEIQNQMRLAKRLEFRSLTQPEEEDLPSRFQWDHLPPWVPVHPCPVPQLSHHLAHPHRVGNQHPEYQMARR